jgi:predicted nucleic acid-binding protein
MLFVDTSAWFAYFFPLDAEHERVKNCFQSAKMPRITTDYCVDETLTLLAARGETSRALEAGREFFQGNLSRQHFVTKDQIERAWILFRQRAAAGWSFTDCTSKIVIDDLDVRTAAALDDHFRQFGSVVVMP